MGFAVVGVCVCFVGQCRAFAFVAIFVVKTVDPASREGVPGAIGR